MLVFNINLYFDSPEWATDPIISLHIRSMWETICDAWACCSGWNFGPNSTEYPYSEIQFQNTPPEFFLSLFSSPTFCTRYTDLSCRLVVCEWIACWRLVPEAFYLWTEWMRRYQLRLVQYTELTCRTPKGNECMLCVHAPLHNIRYSKTPV